jgi:hypothetical protein
MTVRGLANPSTLVAANEIILDISGLFPPSSFKRSMATFNGIFWRSKVRYAERIDCIWLASKPFLSSPILLMPRITDGYPSAMQNGRMSFVTLFIPPINANAPIRANCTTPVFPLMTARSPT